MKEVVVVNGVRTAIGTFGGTIKDIPVVQLGSLVIKGVLQKTNLKPASSEKVLDYAPEKLKGTGLTELEKKYYDWDSALKEVQVDEVIMGNVLTSGQGQNTARQAMIQAGVTKETNAFTINKVCASGLKAAVLGTQSIQLDQADVVIAGGELPAMDALELCRWLRRQSLPRYVYTILIGLSKDVVSGLEAGADDFDTDEG